MRLSSRTLFFAGTLFAFAAFSAGLAYCARNDAPAWQQLTAAESARKNGAASNVDLSPRVIPDDARCPVCGMYPARFPHWAAQLVFRDGSARFFDSLVECLVFQREIDHYGKGALLADIVAGFVKDFEKGVWLEATQAFYVHGSDVTGPMRAGGLPAFATRAAAAAFVAQHGGKVLVFAQITDHVLDDLVGGGHHDHAPN